tara:strand:+ start:757 stop:924 length:168 start_codon:yes stop_codon:yes gene_type:complete
VTTADLAVLEDLMALVEQVSQVQAELELLESLVLVERPMVLVQFPAKVMGINHQA